MRIALLHGPWTWRTRWPVYAGAGTALVALVVTLALVVPGGGGSTDQLLADDPTPTPTATLDATPTPPPSPSESATAAPNVSAEPPPTASAVAEPPAPQLDAEHLLSNGYVNGTFGQGRPGQVGTWSTYGAPLACNNGWDWEVRVARTWAWPDEIVAGETLAVLDSEAAASTKLTACRKRPYGEADRGVSKSLDLGDEAYVSIDREELFTQLHAGARLGRVLVLFFWRQSGPVTDSKPLEAALRAAVAKVREQAEGTPVAAPTQRTPVALRGFLTYEQIAPFAQQQGRWMGMNWRGDTRFGAALTCGDGNPGQAPLSTRDGHVSRRWIGGLLNGDDGHAVTLNIASAAEGSDPAADFAACRESAAQAGYRPSDIADLGDEAFEVDWSARGDTPTVFVRAGSTYLVLITHFLQTGDEVAIARRALDRYLGSAAP